MLFLWGYRSDVLDFEKIGNLKLHLFEEDWLLKHL